MTKREEGTATYILTYNKPYIDPRELTLEWMEYQQFFEASTNEAKAVDLAQQKIPRHSIRHNGETYTTEPVRLVKLVKDW